MIVFLFEVFLSCSERKNKEREQSFVLLLTSWYVISWPTYTELLLQILVKTYLLNNVKIGCASDHASSLLLQSSVMSLDTAVMTLSYHFLLYFSPNRILSLTETANTHGLKNMVQWIVQLGVALLQVLESGMRKQRFRNFATISIKSAAALQPICIVHQSHGTSIEFHNLKINSINSVELFFEILHPILKRSCKDKIIYKYFVNHKCNTWKIYFQRFT